MKITYLFSLIYGSLAVQHQQHYSAQEVEDWKKIITLTQKHSPAQKPELVLAHLIDENNKVLLCQETTGTWAAPMRFMMHQDPSSTHCAQELIRAQVGIYSSGWQPALDRNLTVGIPTESGTKPFDITTKNYVSSKFFGKLQPNKNLYHQCLWLGATDIPSNNNLSNVALKRELLQELIVRHQLQQKLAKKLII